MCAHTLCESESGRFVVIQETESENIKFLQRVQVSWGLINKKTCSGLEGLGIISSSRTIKLHGL